MASPMAMPMPGGGVLYGPYQHVPFLLRFWWFNLALLLIAAGLIAGNGAALLSAGFFATWSAIFPWVASLGSFGFILGIVLGLVLMGAFLLYLLGFRVLAALLTFPTVIVSLFIGGGFIAGMLVGILAGLLILLSERYRGVI